MATKTIEAPEEQAQRDQGIVHAACHCSPNVALCGADVTGQGWTNDGLECIVCAELASRLCPKCGW